MHGKGCLYYKNGKLAYEGEWKDDLFNKFGHYYNNNPRKYMIDFDIRNLDNIGNYWERYEGDFATDKKNGTGIWYFTNGERYAGAFFNDMIHGYGTFF